jgi:hypothetical protein
VAADLIVNYGLMGEKWNTISGLIKPDAKIINPPLNLNKRECIEALKDVNKVYCPEVWERTSVPDSLYMPYMYLKKPIFSIGGKNITYWDGSKVPEGFYIQERIKNRAYELRVHACNWVPIEAWLVSKRTHPLLEQAITWNKKTGGTFSSVNNSNVGVFKRAKKSSSAIIKKLGLQFGALDFIVSNDDEPFVPWFIEVNTSPGLKVQSSKDYYIKIFKELLNQN